MRRPLVINFFAMNTPSHIYHGTWRSPQSKGTAYNDLNTWLDLARLAEKNRIDGIFFADVFGLYESFGGAPDSLIANAVQFPVSDPWALVSAMSAVTENVGFICTNSVLQQHPFAFARTASTLDHLTRGRIGWNMVTSVSKHGSRCMGLETVTDHEERYRWAEEYADVTYKLWEGSWDDGAVVRDTKSGRYADPGKVHRIDHVGKRYRVEGPHLVEPSPQRTPVLFQAGASASGESFAARHAEGVFLVSGSPNAAAQKVKGVLARAEALGRGPEDILFAEGMSIVVGSTMEEAKRKEAENEGFMNEEAVMLMMGGATGLDLSGYSPDTALKDLIDKAPGMHGAFKLVMDNIHGRTAVVRDLLQMSNRRMSVVGTPETIADTIEEYIAVGVHGINLINQVLPSTYVEFCEHVVPELTRRGLMQTDYAPGTLREKLFRRGAGMPENHPARKYRGAFK